jgi:hypothetical protein
MDPLQSTNPRLRRNLRVYLFRYRHLQPLSVASVALDELEMALQLLGQSVDLLPSGGSHSCRVHDFLTARLTDQEERQ